MKSANSRYQYYIEGKCEKHLIRTLIEHQLILPGKTEVLNPVQEAIKATHLRLLPKKTTIVLIFDTDTPDIDMLKKNLGFLRLQPNIHDIITIPQIRNLEDELLRCTDIHRIRDLLNCSHDSDFKTAFVEEKRLFEKLTAHKFDIRKLWSSSPIAPYTSLNIQNQGERIKLL